MKKNRRKKTDPAAPKFFFTRAGRVQFWEEGDHRGMLLTRDRPTAMRVAAWLKTKGQSVSVAEAGTFEGETIEGLLNASIEDGANSALIVDTLRDDGMPDQLLFVRPPASFHGPDEASE